MSEFIKFYLTQLNSIGVAAIAILILLILLAFSLAKDLHKLTNVIFCVLLTVFFTTIFVLSSSHFEIDSSAKWHQLYPNKENVSKISMKFEDDSMSQQLDSNVVSDTLYSIKNYHDESYSSLKTVKVIAETKSGKEERMFYLSRNNRLVKRLENSEVVIDKIEYRKIDGVRRHFKSFSGNLEKRDVRYELRITYKNDNSRPTVFEE